MQFCQTPRWQQLDSWTISWSRFLYMLSLIDCCLCGGSRRCNWQNNPITAQASTFTTNDQTITRARQIITERGLKPPGATTAAPAFSPALELFALLRGQRRYQQRNCVTSAADEKLVFCGNKKNSLKHVFNHTSLVQKKDVTYFTKKYLSVGQALFWRFSDGRCFITMHSWSLSLYPFARQASFLLETQKL